MSFYRPKSILKLILIGFVFVSLPLVVALVIAGTYVDQLVKQSQQAVQQTAQVTSGSRMLVEQVTTMERSARQFLVLDDEAMFGVYTSTHQDFLLTVAKLSQLPFDQALKAKLKELETKAQDLFAKLSIQVGDKTQSKTEAVMEFVTLSEMAQAFFTESSRLVDREVEILQETAGTAQRTLFWLGIALVPLVGGLIGVFAVLITRPINRIDQAIRQLGNAEFSTAIAVTGPRDLESLGERLDWLRLRLIELEEEKNKFLRNISHDLKTPLAAIREGSELLVDEVVGKLTDEQREIARILRQNGIQLQILIEGLLNFNIASARSAQVQFSQVKLHELIDKVIEDHRPAFMAKSIRLDKSCAELAVAGDRERLRMIIDNLLSNAVNYTPHQGTIMIRLRRMESAGKQCKTDNQHEGAVKPGADVAVLDVADSGPGINPSERHKVFETFYRGSIPHDGYIKGTGLGLSIAKEYVMAHGGSIELVEDGTLASGAHFRVTLPVGGVS
ncbi:MAG: ATP-binding protein [Gammaproteobacteria bacterium]